MGYVGNVMSRFGAQMEAVSLAGAKHRIGQVKERADEVAGPEGKGYELATLAMIATFAAPFGALMGSVTGVSRRINEGKGFRAMGPRALVADAWRGMLVTTDRSCSALVRIDAVADRFMGVPPRRG